MKTDVIMLTLLYSVSFTAFIGAINARGPARVIISYFLAILTLCAAVFHTSQSLASREGISADDAVILAPPAQPLMPSESVVISAPEAASQVPAADHLATSEGKSELKSVLESARGVSRNLSSLNLGAVAEISDEEYEALQNRAVGYLSAARRAKDKLAAAAPKVTPQLQEAQGQLSKGIESLVSAAYHAERFFKSENDAEEKQHTAAFKRGTQEANETFRKVSVLLGVEAVGE